MNLTQEKQNAIIQAAGFRELVKTVRSRVERIYANRRVRRYRVRHRDQINERRRLARQQHPEQFRAQDRKDNIRALGLSPERYEQELQRQGGKCLVCLRSDVRLVIDHDHSCCPRKDKACGKCFRGLLCSNCNTALGLLKDNPDNITRLLEYLNGARHTENY